VRTDQLIHYFGERQTGLETPAGAACCYGAAAYGLMPGLKGIADLHACVGFGSPPAPYTTGFDFDEIFILIPF
jgi:hypothetical protein